MQLNPNTIKKEIIAGDSSPAIIVIKHKEFDPALKDPIQEVFRLSVQSLSHDFPPEIINQWGNASSEFVLEMMSDFYSFYTFYIDDNLIGLAGFPKRGFLQLFYFHPHYQKMGFGTRCLNFIESDNNQNRESKIGLRAHHGAALFYQRNGYTQVGESVFKLGSYSLPVAIMEKAFTNVVED